MAASMTNLLIVGLTLHGSVLAAVWVDHSVCRLNQNGRL